MRQRIEKPWGYELIWVKNDNYIGKLLNIEEGHQISLQLHPNKTESMFVIEGFGHLFLGQNKILISEDDNFTINKNQVHTIIAKEKMKIIEVSTAHENDTLRLYDPYERDDNRND